MISCVVVFDGRVTRVAYDDTDQWLLVSCVKFSQTTVVVLKNSFRNNDTFAELGRLIFRAFQCEMEPDYTTVSRLLLDCPSSKSFVKALRIGFS